jgi:hypothetical protein
MIATSNVGLPRQQIKQQTPTNQDEHASDSNVQLANTSRLAIVGALTLKYESKK